MGFKDKISDEIVNTICAVLEKTGSMEMAAAQAKVSRRAVNHWMSLGAQCKDGSRNKYKIFLDKANAAMAACSIPIANAARNAAKGGFELRPLHKRYQDNFGRWHELPELELDENGQPKMILCEVERDIKATHWWLERRVREFAPPEQKLQVTEVPLEQNPVAVESFNRIERLKDGGRLFKTAGGEPRQLPAPDEVVVEATPVKKDPDDISDE